MAVKEEKLKKIWDYCCQENWSVLKITTLANKNKTSYATVMLYMKRYSEEVLKMSGEEFNKMITCKRRTQSEKTTSFFRNLLNTKSEEEIIEFLSSYERDQLNAQKRKIEAYLSLQTDLSEDERTFLDNTLKEKFKIYYDYLDEKKCNKRPSPAALEGMLIFEDYLDDKSSYNLEHYLSKQCDARSYKKLKDMVRRDNPGLYEQVIAKAKAQEASIIETLKFIVDSIKNWSDEKDFDILDYYSMTSIPVYSMKKYSSKLESDDNRLFCNTFSLNTYRSDFTYFTVDIPLSEKAINDILISTDEVGCEKGCDGVPIYGTGRVITFEEKSMLIEYLEINNMPVTELTYLQARRKYLNSCLAQPYQSFLLNKKK